MFKILIADDERKIREGLCKAIDWEALNIKVIGTASDGEEALIIAHDAKPDICLVDICMPAINGLDLIQKLKEENPKLITIIITGHDEFNYAQKAVKLNVFDYILKPVSEKELLKIILKAKTLLEENTEREKRYEQANIHLKRNMYILRERFVLEWFKGEMTNEEVQEQLKFYGIEFEGNMGIVLLKTQGISLVGKSQIEWERQLLLFAIKNVFEEMLSELKPYTLVQDSNENFVALVTVKEINIWNNFKTMIENNAEKYLKHRVVAYQKLVDGMDGVSLAYEEIKKYMYCDAHCLPVVRKVKLHIEKNYANPELNMRNIANELEVSVSHLSKLFKQEVGIPFTDYLIKVRITESIKLMNDTRIKIYEIAERVGYSSQHYFCVAFKNVLGISPSEYRQHGI